MRIKMATAVEAGSSPLNALIEIKASTAKEGDGRRTAAAYRNAMTRLFISMPIVLVVYGAATCSAHADSLMAQGKVLVETNCARCHAIGATDVGSHSDAPAFRTLSQKTQSMPWQKRWPKGSRPAIRTCRSSWLLRNRSMQSLPISGACNPNEARLGNGPTMQRSGRAAYWSGSHARRSSLKRLRCDTPQSLPPDARPSCRSASSLRPFSSTALAHPLSKASKVHNSYL